LLCISGLVSASTVPARAALPAEVLAHRAVSTDSAEARSAIVGLRALGPTGLEILFQVYGEQLAWLSGESPRDRASNPEWQRLTAALDGVSRQRDSFASRLYWYTDIEQAKAAARASGKPILSLRLLGNLDEEYSCANSRFFRSILYANPQVSAVLRSNFILHWKSVRPAPRVTIDFGDGRKIERTVTGNSIHYVLDTDGRPIDGIPGLYGPAAFLRVLNQALGAFRSVQGLAGVSRETWLRAYHQTRRDVAAVQLRSDIGRAGARVNPQESLAEPNPAGPAPSAGQAAPRAMTKMTGEFKTLKSIGALDTRLSDLAAGLAAPAPVLAETDMSEWEKIAALHAADAKLDACSVSIIRAQYPSTDHRDPVFARMINNLERYVALDTVRNEYLMHAKLHQWFAEGSAGSDVEALNERVYASLFLTPRSDPWLGLLLPDTYTGLVDGGVVRER